MRAWSVATGLFVTCVVLGCAKGKEAGTEGGPCYGNETCNSGLVCLSRLCVQPPKNGPEAATAPARREVTCEDAVDHAMKLMMESDEMKGASPEEKKMAEGLMSGLTGEMVKECKEKQWDARQRGCVMDARAMADLEGCDTKGRGGSVTSAPEPTDPRDKAIEAVQGVRKLYDGARVFFLELNADGSRTLPPGHIGPTPPVGSCCASGGRCKPAAARWEDVGWQRLKFSMEDPHYYSYEYENKGGNAFVVRAIGDLDCDGTYSTFEMNGRVNGDNIETDGLKKTRPLE